MEHNTERGSVTAEQALEALAYLDMRRGYGQIARETIRAYIESTRAPQSPKVVAAFISPDTQGWQSRPVNVTEDGAWHTMGWDGKWSADLPPLPALAAQQEGKP